MSDASHQPPEDRDLLDRALGNLHRLGYRGALWAAVADLFAIGSTSAQTLCERLGYDPHQQISARKRARKTP